MFCFMVVVMREVVRGFGAWRERASSLNGRRFHLGFSQRMPRYSKHRQGSQTSVSIWKKPDFKGMTLKLIYLIIKIKQNKMQQASSAWSN